MKTKDPIKYYDYCHEDYRLIWELDKAHGLHYGYHTRQNKSLVDAISNTNKTVSECVCIKKEDIVIDAGCGIGGTAVWIAKNIGAKVIGINLNEMHLKNAQALVLKEKVTDKVFLIKSNFCNSGIADASADVFIAVESMCYAADKSAALKESYRILRDGGRIVVADFFLPKPKNMLGKFDQAQISILEEAWVCPNFAVIDEFCQEMKHIGFKNISIEDKSHEIRPSSIRLFVMGLLYYPISFLYFKIGKENHYQYMNCFNSITQYIGLLRNNWRHILFSAQK